MNYLEYIISFIIIGIGLYFYIKEEKRKQNDYFEKNKNIKDKVVSNQNRKIDTENHIIYKTESLPIPIRLRNLCKSISALEAIFSQDWESRYFSYQKNWGNNGEFCEMRNGSGDNVLILFTKEGTVINGFAHESEMNIKYEKNIPTNIQGKILPNIWKGILDDLPIMFNDFIFGEPVKSIGTTFCIWQTETDKEWKRGRIKFPKNEYKDGSNDLLKLLDDNPLTYKNFAEEHYYEGEINIKVELIEKIYEGIKITKDLVLEINPELQDFSKLKSDLNEIGYDNEL